MAWHCITTSGVTLHGHWIIPHFCININGGPFMGNQKSFLLLSSPMNERAKYLLQNGHKTLTGCGAICLNEWMEGESSLTLDHNPRACACISYKILR